MKIIDEKNYYKMSELVEQVELSNHTIAFYHKKAYFQIQLILQKI